MPNSLIKKKILIVGAGQIGQRHLESILQSKINVSIVIVDSSDNSLDRAKKFLKDLNIKKSLHKVYWKKTLTNENNFFDIAIIATSSKNRANIIKKISDKIQINYWIIEKILAQSKKEINLIETKLVNAKGVWVNTPRRLMTWHKKLKNQIHNKGILSVKMVGGLWGICCNSIHFIDLVCWYTGEKLISINTNNLNQSWIKSKRNGYFEVTGDLYAYFSSGTKLLLRSNPKIKKRYLYVKFTDKKTITIDEDEGVAFGNKKYILKGKLKLQSQMTGPMISKILTKGVCELPTLHESAEQHKIFINAMLNHWNTYNKCKDKKVPIT
jgi:predicted dehydrogenase